MKRGLKTLIAVACSSMMILGMAGCGSKNAEDKGDKKKSDVIQSIKDMKLPKLEDNYTVKLGYYNCDHMTAACLAKDAGIYEALGLKVEVTGNGKVPQAMSAGQMDAGYISFQNVTRGLNNNTPITIAANNHDGGSYYLVVANDVNEPKDLVGQKLGIGTEPEKSWSWRQMAKDMNIPVEGKNYQGINFDSDKSAYVALKTGQIKGYLACDPWGSMAEHEKTGKIMNTFNSLEGQKTICCVFSLNDNFIKDHPEVAKRLVLAHTKAVEYLYSHPYESAKIFAKNYSVPEEVGLMTVYKKTVKEGRTITWDIDEAAIDRRLKENIEKGDYKEVDKAKLLNKDLIGQSKADDFKTYIKEKVDPVFPVGMSYDEWLKKAKELAGEK